MSSGYTVTVRSGPDYVLHLDVDAAVDRETNPPMREAEWRKLSKILRAVKDENEEAIERIQLILQSRLQWDKEVLVSRTEDQRKAPHIEWRRSALKAAEYQVSRTKKFIKILEDEINGKSNHS